MVKYSKSMYFVLSVLIIMLAPSCCRNPNICLFMKPSSCPGIDLAGTLLHLSETDYNIVYLNPFDGTTSPTLDINHTVPTEQRAGADKHSVNAVVENSTATVKYIEGYEVNSFFWSKDSYRKYSYSEIFKKKFGREPTQAELDAITCEQAKQWFADLHTNENWWGDDPPEYVRCFEQPYTKYCFTMNSDIAKITGYLEFPNGQKCKIQDIKLESSDFDPCDNPHNVEIKLADNCIACGPF